MSFRNHVAGRPRQEEAACEFAPDLAAIARRLSDEAELLARKFPADDRGVRAGTIARAAGHFPDDGIPEPDLPKVYLPNGSTEARNLRPFSEPPGPACLPRAATRVIRRRIGAWSGVVGAATAAMIVAILSWRAAERFNDGMSPELVGSDLREQPSQLAQLDEPSGRVGAVHGESVTGNVLKGLSGAEQEAVLDLLEADAESTASLSI